MGRAEWGQHLPPAGEQSGQAERRVPSGKWVSKWARFSGGAEQGWYGRAGGRACITGGGTVNGAGAGRTRQSPAHGPAPPPGVILARYPREWREPRRFSVSTLRNFGPGKKSLEQWVTEEASGLCEAFADHAGENCGRGTPGTGMDGGAREEAMEASLQPRRPRG